MKNKPLWGIALNANCLSKVQLYVFLKVGRKDGGPMPGEDEPLHAYVTASNPESVKKAVDKVMYSLAHHVIFLPQKFLENTPCVET